MAEAPRDTREPSTGSVDEVSSSSPNEAGSEASMESTAAPDQAAASSGSTAAGAPTGKEQFAFQTEVNQVLQLLVHSLYTKREVFLRELISNAADALSKIQFELLTDKAIASKDAPLEILVDFDVDKRTITVSDTGVGMTREELITNLGTIAHSGSKAFLEALEAQRKQGGDVAVMDLIGQFGVGFYSVFMVADKVVVDSRSMDPDASPWKWVATGAESFIVEPGERTQRGTTVTLYLKDDAGEFLSRYRLEDIIKTYSNFVPFPVKLQGNVVNRQKALWAESKSEITEEMYNEFYGHLNHTTKAPLAYVHLQADVPIQFSAILYIPHETPLFQYYVLESRHGVRLYVKRMFIQENCEELVPRYLRFLVGVVDVDDLPLNVSREMIQKNPLLAKVRSNLTRKVLRLLKDMAEKEPDKYATFWKNFGLFIKEGIREDASNRETLAELLRFNSSHHVDADGLTSLEEYVNRMPEGQTEIYYFTGPNRETIERTPHLEQFRKKHYEVLYLTDPIDPLVVLELGSYKDKKFRIIDDPTLDLGAGETDKTQEAPALADDFVAFVGKVLGDKVESVRLSRRLVESAVCLVNPEHAMSSDMQRLYSMVDKDFKFSRKILELNPAHPAIRNLNDAFQAVVGDPSAQERLRPYIHNLLDMALLAEGIHPNPAELVDDLDRLLTVATGTLRPASSHADPASEPAQSAEAKADGGEGEPSAPSSRPGATDTAKGDTDNAGDTSSEETPSA